MIVVDTHVHLYPGQSGETLLAAAWRNLGMLGAPDAARVIVITDRSDCEAFARLRGGDGVPAGWGMEVVDGARALRVRHPDGGALWVVRGCQVATAERLEVLGVGVTVPVSDGVSAAEAIAAVVAADGVPVLPWAVGKWLGARGRQIGALMACTRQDGVMLADSALRAYGWPVPGVLRRAARVAAGTDPLPLPGEETRVGRYATRLDAAFDVAAPCGSVLKALRDGAVSCRPVGRRLALPALLRRMVALRT